MRCGRAFCCRSRSCRSVYHTRLLSKASRDARILMARVHEFRKKSARILDVACITDFGSCRVDRGALLRGVAGFG